jgi:hypothetical protein
MNHHDVMIGQLNVVVHASDVIDVFIGKLGVMRSAVVDCVLGVVTPEPFHELVLMVSHDAFQIHLTSLPDNTNGVRSAINQVTQQDESICFLIIGKSLH